MTLAEMAGGGAATGPTLADMASGRVVEVGGGPSLADMARAAPSSHPTANELPPDGAPVDLRALLKGSRGSKKAGHAAAGADEDVRATFSYEAAKAEMEQQPQAME